MAAAKGGVVQISEPRIEEHLAMVVAGVFAGVFAG